jgi:hypothetical protein
MPHTGPLLSIICTVLLAGCADFNNMERHGVIQTRLPAENAAGIVDVKLLDTEIPRGVQFLEAILRDHGLTRLPEEEGREASNTSLALQVMTHPGTISNVHSPQALRSTWILRIDHPGTIPDKILCSIYPPESGNIMQTSVTAEYPFRTPKQATELWQDLTQRLISRYGVKRVTYASF